MRWNDVSDMPCSVARTLSVIGDRWTMLILRDAFRHPIRFERLHQKLRTTRHLLSARLLRLVEEGILAKQLYTNAPKRYEYVLTEKGKDLFPVLLAMMKWGDEWMDQDRGPPVLFSHHKCGSTVSASFACSVCGEPLTIDSITSVKGPGFATLQ